MRLRYTICFIILLNICFINKSYSQGERDNWYFGQLAGMRFDGNSLESLSDNTIERRILFNVIEGPDNLICANDEDGNLLFYSDGRTFRNRLHQDLLNSPTNEYAVWYSQAAISRDPGNPDKYYVFVIIQDGLKNFLTYTIVDMSLNNGLGGLDPNNTHVVIANNVGQQLTTAQHANGKDLWLLAVRKGAFNAYLITENGISFTPVTSNDQGISFLDGNFSNFGMMEISPSNNLLAACFPVLDKLLVLLFNNLNGKFILFSEKEVPGITSAEFSSNNQFLYTSSNSGTNQYNLLNLGVQPIQITIGAFPYLKRGPDGKIYTIRRGEFHVGAIQNPNVLGSGANYVDNVLSLSGPNLLDLPTFMLPKKPEGISFINICHGETTEFTFTGAFREQVSYEWDFGDGTTATGANTNHQYTTPGTYNVSVMVTDSSTNSTIFSDIKEITIYDSPNNINITENLYLCSEDTTIFFSDFQDSLLGNVNENIFNILYYFSEEDALLKNNSKIEYIPVIGTKTIWVRIENKFNPLCFSVLNFNIETPEFIDIDIPTEQYICSSRTGLTLSAPDGFIDYQWSNGENTQNITVNQTGLYTLTVIKDFGSFTCEAKTSISVRQGEELPIIEEIKVIDWSQNHNSIEVILSRSGAYEFSIDGINFQQSNIFENLPFKEDYKVYVRDINCQKTIESDKLFLLYFDKFFTPNGDGRHDYWRVINNFREEDIKIQIFDRYGKLLKTMSYFDRGWDGTYNGIEMPTSDYWFRVVRQNGDIHLGHFTLKR